MEICERCNGYGTECYYCGENGWHGTIKQGQGGTPRYNMDKAERKAFHKSMKRKVKRHLKKWEDSIRIEPA